MKVKFNKIISLSLITVMLFSMSACASDFSNAVDTIEKTSVSLNEAAAAIEENADDIQKSIDEYKASKGKYFWGKPWIDSDLKDNITADMEVSPQDDFHLYVNKDWILAAEFMEGMSTHGPFMDLYYKVMNDAKSILTDNSLKGDDAALVQSLYNAVIDWDARNAAGIEPIRPVFEKVKGIESIEEMTEILGNADESLLVSALFSIGNIVDFNDSSSYIFAIGGTDLLLKDASEYTERTAMGDRYYNAYKKAAIAMLKKFDISEEDAAKMFDDAISYETRLAKVSFTSAEQMDPSYLSKINNIMTFKEAKELAGDYPLEDIMDAFGIKGVEKCLVLEPGVLKKAGELYNDENLESLKAYILVKLVIENSGDLDRDSYEIYAKIRNEITGSEGMEPDEDMAYNKIKAYLYEPLARAYMQKYDASKKKENITKMCEEIIAAYKEMLAEEDWMAEETRAKAIEKLDNIKINSVYPDKWVDMSSLKLNGLSYFDMGVEIAKFNLAKNASYTNGKVDKDIWDFDILDQNAYYNSQNNSINIILGFLGDEYYSDDFSKEQMYAAIGTVIGHEISHAFDPNGSQFDKDGNMVMWWTQEDYAAFQDRADKLIKYYDSIEVFTDTFVPGNNWQTEAVADMAGLKVILKIAEKYDDFDYDKFFTQYATIYRRIDTPELEEYMLNQDVHPLHYLRTNCALQQFDEFLDLYGVKEDDNMYLAPEDRVLVW